MNYSREAMDLARYQAAVADHPKGQTEHPFHYIARIAELVAGGKLPEPLQDMPEVRLPYRESE